MHNAMKWATAVVLIFASGVALFILAGCSGRTQTCIDGKLWERDGANQPWYMVDGSVFTPGPVSPIPCKPNPGDNR